MADASLKLRVERQLNPIADDVSAIAAVICPVLEGVLYAISGEMIAKVGGHKAVTLSLLPRLYVPGDGDCGICFEYAVHDAIKRGEPTVIERIVDCMGANHCGVPGNQTASILFGAEKNGALKLIDTAHELLTEDSHLLTGTKARPVKLRRYIPHLANALRSQRERDNLPTSISGAWKADLFIGNRDSDKWVGTTVKINPRKLESAKGLRIGIIPSESGKSDAIRFDDKKNILVCPLPYDASFVELFYTAWVVVKSFMNANGRLPDPAFLPRPSQRVVAKWLEERRDFPVLDVIVGIRGLAQPYLLESQQHDDIGSPITDANSARSCDRTVIAPISKSQ